MNLAIKPLAASASLWEIGGYIASIFVFIGVALEGAELFKAIRSGKSKEKVASLYREAANAQNEAAASNEKASNAAKQAANLGVTENSLNDFVQAQKVKADRSISLILAEEKRLQSAAKIVALQNESLQTELQKSQAQIKETKELALSAYESTKPRMILFCTEWWALKDKRKPSSVELLYVANAGDALLFARSIQDCLGEASWPNPDPKPFPLGQDGSSGHKNSSMLEIEDPGIEILGSRDTPRDTNDDWGNLFARNSPPDEIASAISDSLPNQDLRLFEGVADDLPSGAVRIIVFPK